MVEKNPSFTMDVLFYDHMSVY